VRRARSRVPGPRASRPRAGVTGPRAAGRRALAAFVVAASSIAWLDPHAALREANRLYAAGKFEEAESRYNAALVDDPDSPVLRFNRGAALFKQGKHEEALRAFEQAAAAGGDERRAARAAYNLGNAKFRLGEQAEASEPQAALERWAEALAAYRRAIGADPEDLDAKLNYEVVRKRIADLKKRLEEERERQEQQPPEEGEERQQEQEQGRDGQPGDEEQEEQQQPERAEDERGEQPEEQPGQEPQPKPEASEPPSEEASQPASGGETEPEKVPGEMSRHEAAALLDAEKDREVRPDEIIKRLDGVVAEPAQDW
jgi:Ca-activated chloride channel family protein